ncbi:hypothetical protein IU444_28905 [Nocardia farcinica]|uniref:hypothetical protein n=1 Tax=Nocardia farcinica TaxID=37329 RepID=UPI001895677B|nr:hypothetical protein [Nocardia farcinica]MBF6388151.1 hypothetical protein [Nocardia farcinica]UEX26349.1 hypothetical protein LMJ57_31260 [Nocardia farcinica]
MSKSSSAAQQSALDTALRLFDLANAAGAAVLAAADASSTDSSDLAELFRSWRAQVTQTCTAVRAFCDACGPDGPDAQLLDGATPPRELWTAGVDTLTASFSDRLARWDQAALKALAEEDEISAVDPDPALPVMEALGRLANFLADRWQERTTAEITSAFADYQREHGGRVDSRSTITPGGGKRTEVSFSFDRAGAAVPERSDRPSWWARLFGRGGQLRTRAELLRTYRALALSLRHREERKLHDALETSIAAWLGHSDDDALRGPWYASYFITSLLRGLGHRAVHLTAEIEKFVPTGDGAEPKRVSWIWDATGLPPALIWLPAAGEVIDLLGGDPWLEGGVRPRVISDVGEVSTGTILRYADDRGREVQYTIVDDLPRTGPHAARCEVIDRHVADSLLPRRSFQRHRA